MPIRELTACYRMSEHTDLQHWVGGVTSCKRRDARVDRRSLGWVLVQHPTEHFEAGRGEAWSQFRK